MEHITFGKTGLKIFPVALGTAGYGATLSQEEAFAQMDFYREYGGNFLDTARCYNDWIPGERSRSEKTIGAWISQTGRREELVISTKGGHPPFDDLHAPRLANDEVRGDLEGSLADLHTDYIDLYFLHRDDERLEVGYILENLEDLRAQGKIRHYGCSNWRLPRLAKAYQYAQEHGLEGFACNQLMWSLARTNPAAMTDDTLVTMDGDTAAWHTQTQTPAMAYSSQGKGYFARADQGDIRPGDRLEFDSPQNARALETLQQISRQTGVAVATLAVHYILCAPYPAVPIVSSKNQHHLAQALAAARLTLDPQHKAQLAGLQGMK